MTFFLGSEGEYGVGILGIRVKELYRHVLKTTQGQREGRVVKMTYKTLSVTHMFTLLRSKMISSFSSCVCVCVSWDFVMTKEYFVSK